jgi:hypothetical protein
LPRAARSVLSGRETDNVILNRKKIPSFSREFLQACSSWIITGSIEEPGIIDENDV